MKKSPKWSAKVTRDSHAMSLDKDVFKKAPKQIARSLKRSAESSHNLKSSPFRSAMSMLNFFINRAGKNLKAGDKKRLDAAKVELRKLFRRPATA